MMTSTTWLWIGFGSFTALMLALDLGVFQRKAHVVKMREALTWSAIWFALALLFNAGIWFWKGHDDALDFFTCYVVEWSLSVDNLFVFLLLFANFQVPPQQQHRVLFWGVLGALVLRGLFVAGGVVLLHKFHPVIYMFGGLLILGGIKTALGKDKEIHPERNPVLRLVRRFLPVTRDYHGGKFFVKENLQRMATPLFVVLVMVEITDLIFAVDSVPAVLGITDDPFIVYTSNVLAILGLRSMFFALRGVMNRFRHLHFGLAAILVFVGAKMVFSKVYKIPTTTSLLVILCILLTTALVSQLRRDQDRSEPAGGREDKSRL